MIPDAYELKRIVRAHRERFWCSDLLGAAEFAPIGISDDGKKTMFQIPPGAPIPSIFRADAKGQEYSVNSSVNGTIITVGARSERWVLRYGDAYVCVEGTKPGAGQRTR